MYVIPEFSSKKIQFNEYSIGKYTKPNVDNGLFRSVVYKGQDIVCFSPPQSILYDDFKKTDIYTVVVQEFIDGTMINLFYDGDWKLCTKSIMDANCKYYSTKTFRELFHETNMDYSQLNKSLCYSFILQHPENRIVTPIETPALYLIATYSIEGNVVREVYEPNSFLKPASYIFETYEYAEKFVLKQPYTFKGLMFKINNQRAKIRNPAYEKVKNLRGNTPDLKFNYLGLTTSAKQEYGQYFPTAEYEQEIEEFTKELHFLYINCFIQKTKALKLYPGKYKCHMYKLHMIYLQELRLQSKIVTKKVVSDYIHKLHPAQLLFSFKYV